MVDEVIVEVVLGDPVIEKTKKCVASLTICSLWRPGQCCEGSKNWLLGSILEMRGGSMRQ